MFPARPHTLYHNRQTWHNAKTTESWMTCHGVRAALIPAKAADLTPIENAWGIRSRRVFAGTKTCEDAESLRTAIKAAWASFQADKQLRTKLVESMTAGLEKVVKRKGGSSDF